MSVSASYLPDASLLYLINSFPLLPMLPIGKTFLFFQAFVQGQTVACNHMNREGADAIPLKSLTHLVLVLLSAANT